MLGVLLSFFSILSSKNNIYAEFGGAGYTRTINYDRKLHKIYNLRIGYGLIIQMRMALYTFTQ